MKMNVSAISLRWNTPTVVAVAALATLFSFFAAPLAQAQDDVLPLKTTDVAVADITPPSNVLNVKAVAGISSVTLTWNVATDDSGSVKGYKVYYGTKAVVSDGDKYTYGPVDIGNKITYTLSGLTTGIPYYFAVTAYDAAGNESPKFSAEVSAVPLLGSADSEAPKIAKAEAVSKSQVRVTFTEAVTLPGINPQGAFSIKKDSDGTVLEVKNASMDATDASNMSVLLTTAAQEAATNYVVTAGIQVKDTAGNPVKSGTSDTALFAGSSKEPVLVTQQTVLTEATTDTVPPEMITVSVPDANHVVATFSEPLKSDTVTFSNFVITEENSIDNTLGVTDVSLSADMKTVTLTTALQKDINYNLVAYEVADAAGNLINSDTNATIFHGAGGMTTEQTQTQQTQGTMTGPDTAAPEDATRFMASVLSKLLVHLSWASSVNSAGDLTNYVLYKSTDGTKYADGVLLDAAVRAFDMSDLVPGMKYFFKLTAKDASGNESQGVVTTLTLPATGPELGFLLFGSLGLGKFFTRKSRKNKK
jgi:hypothetical protein